MTAFRLFAAGLVIMCQAETSLAVTYHITDLGTLSGCSGSRALSVNASGQVVGYAYEFPSGKEHAFVWQSNTGIQELGPLVDWGWSHAEGINASGQIVGYAQTSTSDEHAVLWQSATSGVQDLGNLGGYSSRALDINNSGQVAAFVHQTDLSDHAFLWQNGSLTQDIGGLAGTNLAINANGQVVGSGKSTHAFFWQLGSSPRDLGTFGGAYSYAYDINDNAQAVGGADIGGYTYHAFLWQDGSGLRDIGTLGGAESVAFGINDLAQVVGYGRTSHSTGDLRAFVWQDGIGMQDLNSLLDPSSAGWYLSEARDINDNGQIVGYGLSPSGYSHAFLATPTDTPEPSTFALLGIGAASLFAWQWRKRAGFLCKCPRADVTQ